MGGLVVMGGDGESLESRGIIGTKGGPVRDQ